MSIAGSAFRLIVVVCLVVTASARAAEEDLDGLLGITDVEPEAPEVETVPVDRVEAPRRERQSRVIEEIVVTAQKREEALVDVPIALSVLDGEFLEQEGIADLQELSSYVPNANVRLNPVIPDIRIRGFGTGTVNKAFEQSVGLVVDGVPYNRLPYFITSLFDLQRVEVLRGPQGTLFGKNTIAGLFNMIPRDPTDDFTGSVDVQLGQFDRRRGEVAVGGPLFPDVLNFRLAGLIEEQDGYVKNTTAKVAPGAHKTLLGWEREQLRARFHFPDLFESSWKLSYDWFRVEGKGLGAELFIVPENTRPLFLQFDPNADFEGDNYIASVDHPDGSLSEGNTFATNWHRDFGEWGVDFVGGYSLVDIVADVDIDYSPMPAGVITTADDNTALSLELRTTSPTLPGILGIPIWGNTDLIAGVFYQRRLIEDSFLTLDIDGVVFGEFVARQNVPIAFPQIPPILDGATNERSTLFFEETSDSIAGFGQLDWHIIEPVTLSMGLRLQNEKKKGEWERVFETPTSIVFTQFLNWEEFDAKLEHSEFQVSPKISVNYQPIDEVSLFARWSRGYKGGGFNEFATRGIEDDLRYDQEEVDEWAIDAKTKFFDGAAALNLSLFWMNLQNFQVLTTRPGDIVITVQNAAEARARGVEADFTWLPTDWLTIIAMMGLNDAEYLDFPIGPCPGDMPNTDGDNDQRCDLSGFTLWRTPKWVTAVSPSVTFPAMAIPGVKSLLPESARNVGFSAGITMEYRDVQDVEGFGDPRARQPSFFRFRANFGVGDLVAGWGARIVVDNLTDIATRNGVNEVQTGPGHLWQIPEPPRLVYGQARFEF